MTLSELQKQFEDKKFPIELPGHLIGLDWVKVNKGTRLKGSHNPNDGSSIASMEIDRGVIEKALDCANKSTKFQILDLDQRAKIVGDFRSRLADFQSLAIDIMRVETGLPRWEAALELDHALRYLEYMSTNASEVFEDLHRPARLGQFSQNVEFQPIGTVAAFLPFSTPLTHFALYFSASMLMGCPLVLFSSSQAVANSYLIASIIKDLNIPDNAVSVIFSNFEYYKLAISDQRVKAALYTGSREHCELIRRERRLGRQNILQSGGKNAVIVHSSADLDLAVKCVAFGALTGAGQRCSSTSRVFVYKPLMKEFREKLLEAFTSVKVGRTDIDSGDEPFMGPLYSKKAVDKYLRFQTMANRESTKTDLWGKALGLTPEGSFVAPSIHYIENFDNLQAYQSNVLFSPDVTLYPYDVLDTAIDHINTTDASYVVSFIGDADVFKDRRKLFLAPNLLVNQPTIEFDVALPLAGRLQSGHHRFHGPGLAIYLGYPQVIIEDSGVSGMVSEWPWPKL